MGYRSLLGLIFMIMAAPALADTIAIIGTGDVARALGPEFAQQGHTIVYGSRTPDADKARDLVNATGHGASVTSPAESVIDASIVVMAVPGMLVGQITESLGDLSSKIIIDPTNPLQRDGLRLTHGVERSNAEIIQGVAPDAYVVKAFNTLNWKTMMEPESSGGPVSIPLAGNSQGAKETVASLVSGMGLEPIDVGGVENAHWVEGMLILWINNRYGARDAFEYHLRKTE